MKGGETTPEEFVTDNVVTVSTLHDNWKLVLASIIDIYARSATALIFTDFVDEADRQTVARIKNDAFRLVDIINFHEMLKNE